MMSSSSASSDGGGTVVDDRTSLTYAEVVVSFVTALALLIISIMLFVFRSTWRHRTLSKVQRQNRFLAVHLLEKAEKSPRRRIVEEGLSEHCYRITDPPQYDRVIPAVVANTRDSKQDCANMLKQIRTLLTQTEGRTAELMSMRCCLSCMTGVLPRDQSERFLRIYEAISFGSHRVNGSGQMVSSEDIRFMHAFFYNTVLKQLS